MNFFTTSRLNYLTDHAIREFHNPTIIQQATVIEQRNNLRVIYFNVHKSNIISVSLHKKVRKLPTIRSRTFEKFRLFMEGVVALFDSMRDTEAPARWVYQQNKTTIEIVPCTFSSSRPILPGTKRGPCGAEIACTNRVSDLVVLGFYEVA